MFHLLSQLIKSIAIGGLWEHADALLYQQSGCTDPAGENVGLPAAMVFRQLQRVKGSTTDGNDFEREHLQGYKHAAAAVDGSDHRFSEKALCLTEVKEGRACSLTTAWSFLRRHTHVPKNLHFTQQWV